MKKITIVAFMLLATTTTTKAQQVVPQRQSQQLQLLDSVNSVSVKDTSNGYTYTGVSAILVKQGVNVMPVTNGSYVVSYRVLFYADKKRQPVLQKTYNVLIGANPTEVQIKSMFKAINF